MTSKNKKKTPECSNTETKAAINVKPISDPDLSKAIHSGSIAFLLIAFLAILGENHIYSPFLKWSIYVTIFITVYFVIRA